MKKYLFFIVEGKNDKIEIQAMLRALCGKEFQDHYYDAYHIHNGDVTTEKDTTEKTIIDKLNKIVIDWRQGRADPFIKISPSDVEKIIHVIDMDGAFIPESAIVQTDDAKVQYHDKSIQYFSREQIVGRNRKKAKVVRRLISVRQIDNIPYELFFVSCNMDHLLFNERNMFSDAKGRGARFFASRCKDKNYLKNSIYEDGVRAEGNYLDSWNMIQEEYNSLGRHTNLNLILDSISQKMDAMDQP